MNTVLQTRQKKPLHIQLYFQDQSTQNRSETPNMAGEDWIFDKTEASSFYARKTSAALSYTVLLLTPTTSITPSTRTLTDFSLNFTKIRT
ncbi:hypothetical protein RRG08_029969 [Elysia crispata]|uniref:Uncharacterized protein n=1 Tax=Elysia crispata TaxID=231223 RepID=A0AAE0ZIZ7_9GAST|nr:hypothetical protein RRG08_029969 [Elysia crispata]